jgi:hypothetical protein
MKKFMLVIVGVIFLMQAGCTKAVRYTEEEIKNFSPAVQENIRKARIDLGMSQKEVRYAWGAPDSIKFLEPFEGKTREEWTYVHHATLGVVSSKILLFFEGRLIYIR